MAKDFWEPWEWRLWLGDPDLGMCHPSTRGIWMDALCAMMERKTHSLTGTPDQLARVCRCSVDDFIAAADDLMRQSAAEVLKQNNSITLTNRKRHRELELSGLRSKSGKSGADSRWQKNGKHDGKHDGKPITITVPIPPEGVQGEVFTDWTPNAEQARLNALFNRRPTTPWSKKEIAAWKAVTPIAEDDFKQLERWYSARLPADKDYRRRDLQTLLNNFNAEVDRARRFREPTCL